MKSLVLFAIMVCIVFNDVTAQKKHSFAVGLELAKYNCPKEWRNNHVAITNYSTHSNVFKNNYSIWIAYYFKEKYGFQIGCSQLVQTAEYSPIEEMPKEFPRLRQAGFWNFSVGYNIFQQLRISKLGGWGYCGLSFGTNASQEQRDTYIPGSWEFAGKIKKIDDLYPFLQLQLKYNPLPWFFVNLGGTYRYVFKDFQPLSGNLGLGLQL